MPIWVMALLLAASVLLWLLGTANSDDVIGLLERLLSLGALAVVLFVARPLLLELLGVGLALWLPRAHSGQAPPPLPNHNDVLIPFL
ncbi:hypothetical protein KBZ18_12695 [Synechococcus sp. Cruz-9H2]|uniref:hypothetical protein n=1 Tax=unclassified Synechococcus TaxID=2626047 RepID=UPI0020CD693C|nr:MULTISPECIES: hypothetical protein [unclassified Synechococcus]MCP9820342.1 hypothetical protein [Synechococcus sp. Cruz-9H2]MCP9844650.1 hypothetical protein [Synechococcus sp. Edmonson 11F2]MCP9856772.1 hypothetical protein [Synechococcus sp. Cruz-9C9]MCP9864018.1 hypothetical protein [Synechococcus sp. Cruz-7E5]MCP9871213.1 hypothetical protein [Synechococcus sp. Cruz-7B9]